MAFSSSLAPPHKKNDVFISFRGEDTRNTFTSHLYDAFRRKNIKAYIDEESLTKGDEISPVLKKAIQESKISVVILSENYASSSWCLEELSWILRRKEIDDHVVVPVFYNIKPSIVREQQDSFGVAFAGHEERFKDSMHKVTQWRNALRAVADLCGWDSSLIRQ